MLSLVVVSWQLVGIFDLISYMSSAQLFTLLSY